MIESQLDLVQQPELNRGKQKNSFQVDIAIELDQYEDPTYKPQEDYDVEEKEPKKKKQKKTDKTPKKGSTATPKPTARGKSSIMEAASTLASSNLAHRSRSASAFIADVPITSIEGSGGNSSAAALVKVEKPSWTQGTYSTSGPEFVDMTEEALGTTSSSLSSIHNGEKEDFADIDDIVQQQLQSTSEATVHPLASDQNGAVVKKISKKPRAWPTGPSNRELRSRRDGLS
ncbi:hypothetical protein LTR86_011312 [Recurvomyces mirabilis]|nr:hypothetical protein LTR86_011312 [Recurvomyces mirabilis]